MEDLGQLIFIVLFILFGLISGSKKKKVPPKQRPRRRQVVGDEDPGGGAVRAPAVVRGQPEPGGEAPATVAAEGLPDVPGAPERSLAEELVEMLQQETARSEAPAEPAPQVDDGTLLIETYEAPPSPVHERASEKFVDAESDENPYLLEDTPAPRPYAVDDKPHDRPYLVEPAATPQPYSIRDKSGRKKHLSRSELRHAFIMKEVLGRPKALED